MAYAPMYEMWRVEVKGPDKDAIFDIMLDLGHGEDFPLAGLPWFFGVRIPMAATAADGLPTEDEEVRLNTVENRIRETAKSREGLYVGRRQGLGNRDLLFYFPHRPSGLDDRIRVSVGTEILFISKNDAAWKGYEGLLPLPRDWRTIEDGRVIAELINRGADATREHAVMHRVETSVQKGADALKLYFEKLELEDIAIVGEKPELIVAGVQRVPLNALKISEISFKLDQTAPKARGKYLGWVADPVGDEVANGEIEFDFDDVDDFDDEFDVAAVEAGDLSALEGLKKELASLEKTFAKKDTDGVAAEKPASGKGVKRQKPPREK